jgi:hypothetical protein
MKITFEITVTSNDSDPYTACEIKSLNDGDVWRSSLLQGNSKSIYGAIAKLCLMNLELANMTDEIFMLFKYYVRLYPEAAQLAIKNIQVINERGE